MSASQHRLSEYLRVELYHSLGAYRKVVEGLEDMCKPLAGPDPPPLFPSADLVRMVRDYNRKLDQERHCSSKKVRHPCPEESPLHGIASRRSAGAKGLSLSHPHELRMFEFYATAREALKSLTEDSPDKDSALYRLGDRLVVKRDSPSRRLPFGAQETLDPDADEDIKAAEERRRERNTRANLLAARYETRMKKAADACGFSPEVLSSLEKSFERRAEHSAEQILSEHLGNREGEPPLRVFVMEAFVDAHLTMHAIESRLAVPLKTHFDRGDWFAGVDEVPDKHLEHAIALNTFVFAAARAVPWMFAEDETEAQRVIGRYTDSWTHMVPALAMWTSTQLALLALHHRGFCYKLRGDRARAYKDFHKVQRWVRDAERRISKAPLHALGAPEFLHGLDALADHHIGDLYRSDHAHTSALRHYDQANEKLDRLREGGRFESVMKNSRWYIELLLNRGKAAYEMGNLKESLALYLKSWRAFLELHALDGAAEADIEDVERAIDWLKRVKLDPELHKGDTVRMLKPVIQRLPGISVSPALEALAADVLLRLGHLLFVIRIGNDATDRDIREAEKQLRKPQTGEPVRVEVEDIRDGMAYRCLTKAAECDAHSTLVASDLLKIRYQRLRQDFNSDDPNWEGFESGFEISPLATQAPLGNEDFDRVSRVIEYLVLQELTAQDPSAAGLADEHRIARDLLARFFVHTDSISVRKSQVHQYLVQGARDVERRSGAAAEPFIDFICMRRYSSIFPFFPRPSAFRVLGGGYFVRAWPHEAGEGVPTARPYGIVIDPGPDFVENLYRCGFGLSDIDLVIVTHDHVDHLASLDPLLSLFHFRNAIERPGGSKLQVLANRSVVNRYEQYRRIVERGDERRPLQTSWEVVDIDDHEVDLPAHLSLRTFDSNHVDLGGHPAKGIHIAVEGGRSIAFMSDFGLPRSDDDGWQDDWADALDADVLVAHMSSIPLAELLQLADFVPLEDAEARDQLHEDRETFEHIWEHLSEKLRRRLKYAAWIDYDDARLPVGPIDAGWRPDGSNAHLYLRGLRNLTGAYARRHGSGNRGLLVIGELSEELGTFRGKVAERLNHALLGQEGTKAISADVGLRVTVRSESGTRILCTTCDLDNDLIPSERFHDPDRIFEVCVKGENEGIFYNCRDHDPSHQDEPTFLEQMERYDVFGR